MGILEKEKSPETLDFIRLQDFAGDEGVEPSSTVLETCCKGLQMQYLSYYQISVTIIVTTFLRKKEI